MDTTIEIVFIKIFLRFAWVSDFQQDHRAPDTMKIMESESHLPFNLIVLIVDLNCL